MARTQLSATAMVASLLICSTVRAQPSLLVTPLPGATSVVTIRNSAGEEIYRLEPKHRLRLRSRHQHLLEVILPDERIGFASVNRLRVTNADILANEQSGFEVHFFDIGAGGVALIRVGPTDVLIDGGSDPELLMRHIRPLVHWPLDLVIVTNTERDHWAGVRGLLQTLQPGGAHKLHELWLPNRITACPSQPFDDFTAMARGIPHLRVRFHRDLFQQPRLIHPPSAPEVDVELLTGAIAPVGSDCDVRRDNASLTFIVRIGKYRFLFTSDIRGRDPDTPLNLSGVQYGERMLLNEHARRLREIDVVTIPNHGVIGCTTGIFADALRPRSRRLSAILLGTGDERGDERILRRYNGRRNTSVLSSRCPGTEQHDHIVCKKDGDEISCEPATHILQSARPPQHIRRHPPGDRESVE
jgi:hypothetical protein